MGAKVQNFSHYLSTEEPLAKKQTQAGLAELEHKELAEPGETGWKLIGDGRSFAAHFLLIGQFLRLDAWQLEEQRAVHGTILALQAGLHDNLYLVREEERVLIKSVSSNFLCEITEELAARTAMGPPPGDAEREKPDGSVSDPILPSQSK